MNDWYGQTKQRRRERVASWMPFVVVFLIPAVVMLIFLV
jgi:hypothetical protein